MFDPSENPEKDSAETSVTKNPLNGVGSSPEAVEEEDSEDLFVSTYEVGEGFDSFYLPKPFLFTFQSVPAVVAAPKPAEPAQAAALDDLMNTIDLNEPSSSPSPSPAAASSSLPPPLPSSAPVASVISSVEAITPPEASQIFPSSTSSSSIPATTTTLVQPMVEAPKPPPAQSVPFSLASSISEPPKPETKVPSAPPPAINTASQIEITVSEPAKIGEGMSSYMVYTVSTKTTLPYFRRQSLSVHRRFSDFLGLHDKLAEKHAALGRIVPPPPSKSVVGTAKIKFSKADEQQLSGSEFLEKRRSALERYLQRNAEHPIICADPDFREFLELDADLPRSTSTSALSGAGVKRMFSFVSDTVNKMTFKMDETDTVSAC